MQPVSTMLLHSTKKDWNICILEERLQKNRSLLQTNVHTSIWSVYKVLFWGGGNTTWHSFSSSSKKNPPKNGTMSKNVEKQTVHLNNKPEVFAGFLWLVCAAAPPQNGVTLRVCQEADTPFSCGPGQLFGPSEVLTLPFSAKWPVASDKITFTLKDYKMCSCRPATHHCVYFTTKYIYTENSW